MSEKKEGIGNLSRRQFLKDAGLVVGGTAVSSVFLLSACGKEIEVTKTVTTTAPGATVTNTATTTAPGTTVTSTAPGTTATITKYTCPFCSQEFTSVAALKTHIEAEHVEDIAGPSKKLTKLNINGKDYEVDIEPNWTLQRTLRFKLSLTGTKNSCDHGACGYCTVIIDGRPVLGCMTLAIECVGKKIETIEGIAEANHPLVDSFVKFDVPQCGYCIPGAIGSAKALLDRNPNPTLEEVDQALAGNLCRCTTYYRQPKAVLDAAKALRGGV